MMTDSMTLTTDAFTRAVTDAYNAGVESERERVMQVLERNNLPAIRALIKPPIIERKPKDMKITVWTTSDCVQCTMTKKQMDKHGIRYDEMALEQHPEKLEEFKEMGHLRAPIVITDNKIWTGFRLDKIKSLASYLFGEK
jgi:glutaredoxin-like protein NrdH